MERFDLSKVKIFSNPFLFSRRVQLLELLNQPPTDGRYIAGEDFFRIKKQRELIKLLVTGGKPRRIYPHRLV